MGCPTYAEEKAGAISDLAHALANELDDWKGKAGYCEFAETRIPALEAVVLRVFERLLPLPVEDDLMELLWGALTGDQRALYGHVRPRGKSGTTQPTTDQLATLDDILTTTEAPEKITIALDPTTRSVVVRYEDLDDEWFLELVGAGSKES